VRLIGTWSDPLDRESYHEAVHKAVKRSEGVCAYCGFKSPRSLANPQAGLNVCLLDPSGAPDANNLVTLCDICVRFNDLRNLIGLGEFVELPWLTQSQVTNMLRIAYCVQASSNSMVKQTRLYQGAHAILDELARTPKAWEENGFDGSVEKVMQAEADHRGYMDKVQSSDVVYIDRLRFFFSPSAFKESIQLWLPTVENQVMQVEGAAV